MPAGEIAELHLQASEWFESHGLIEEAIQHAMKAKDAAGAAEIVERHQQTEIDQDRWYIVERWIAQLPEEIVLQRPRLLLAQIWGMYHLYKLLEIPPLLEGVEPLLVDEAADQTLLGEVDFFRGWLLMLLEGDAERALISFKSAREQFHNSQTGSIMGDVQYAKSVCSKNQIGQSSN